MNTAKNHLVATNRRPPAEDIDAEDAVNFSGAARLRDDDTPEHELLREEIERTVTDTVAGAARGVAGRRDLARNGWPEL